jgi:hypothetical protein
MHAQRKINSKSITHKNTRNTLETPTSGENQLRGFYSVSANAQKNDLTNTNSAQTWHTLHREYRSDYKPSDP